MFACSLWNAICFVVCHDEFGRNTLYMDGLGGRGNNSTFLYHPLMFKFSYDMFYSCFVETRTVARNSEVLTKQGETRAGFLLLEMRFGVSFKMHEASYEMLKLTCCFFFCPFPFCSYFSSSHFGFSSRAEKLCWCTWGQLHRERSRGKHYLHYSWLERIYLQYLAFGAHTQVTSRLISNLFVYAFYLWVLFFTSQVFPYCSAAMDQLYGCCNSFVFGC